MTNKLISAVDVAVALLPQKGEKEHIPMTLRKLQKLVYYCQAWSLVWDEVPLFKEEIVACHCCGPVVPEIQEYAVSQFAKLPSKKKGVYEVFNTDMDLCFNGLQKQPSKLSSYQEKTVDRVFSEYQEYGTIFLESMSKEEGPFKKAMRGCKGGNTPPLITIESMQRYYAAVETVRKSETVNRDYNYRNFILDFPAWEGENMHEK